jgi:uncharacterized protein YjbI with pentapeptide repeats
MSDRDGTDAASKTRKNRRVTKTNGTQPPAPQRPSSDDKEAWKAYWKEQGCSWRTEPEIDVDRQKYLNERRTIVPNIEHGIYPFKDIKLRRADVEWLLATHESGGMCGAVDWKDESQREREGLDLRGADLQNVDLNNLPLARLKAGLVDNEWFDANDEQRAQASICLKGAHLRKTKLEGASLSGAQLEEADLYRAQLADADLGQAQLRKANFYRAQLEATNLGWAKLEGAILRGADLAGTHLAGVILSDERRIGPQLADVQWGTNLARVDWSRVMILGDEDVARQKRDEDGKVKSGRETFRDHQIAVRANRQLAVALQAQGLNEDAARFAYRAQLMQRKVYWHQRKFGQYFFSILLDLLAGYGYRPGRSVLWYLAVIFGFAFAYHFLGGLTLYPPDAIIFSIMSFHGRGFFPSLSQTVNLHTPIVMLAALEAIVGLLIEISFIATFTQRFFGK